MSNFSIDNLLAPVQIPNFPGHIGGPHFAPSMAATAPSAAAAQFMFAAAGLQATADLLAAYQWQSTSDPLRVQYFMPGPGFGSPGMCIPGAAGFFSPHHLMMNGKRKRRHRTIFNDEQLAILEKTFNTTQYPDIGMREKLAQECDLKEERVEVWFKNRRAKERKSAKDSTSSNGSSHNSSAHSKSNADSSDCDVSDSESASGDSPAKRRKSGGGDVSPDENRLAKPTP